MSRIVITIDYEPVLSSYPDGIDTKYEAMKLDVEDYRNGTFGLADLLDFAGDIDVQLVDE